MPRLGPNLKNRPAAVDPDAGKPDRRPEERHYLAKRWGLVSGYVGRRGGWIYRAASGMPLFQGWHALYEHHWQRIERWYFQRETREDLT